MWNGSEGSAGPHGRGSLGYVTELAQQVSEEENGLVGNWFWNSHLIWGRKRKETPTSYTQI